MIDKIWNTVRQKAAVFAEGRASEEFVKIGEDTYCEESIIERDGRRYVLLRSIEDPLSTA